MDIIIDLRVNRNTIKVILFLIAFIGMSILPILDIVSANTWYVLVIGILIGAFVFEGNKC